MTIDDVFVESATCIVRQNHKTMGLTVNEDDLHLFVLCADESMVDMDKLKRVHTVKGTTRAPEPSDSDDDSTPVTKAVDHSAKPAASGKKRNDDTSSEDGGEGFAAALNKSSKHHHGDKKKKKRNNSDSEDNDEQDAYSQQEKQRLIMETGRLIREHNLRQFDAPTMRDSLVDVNKKYDAVMRETSVSTSVEGILSALSHFAPLIEMFVLMKVPALKISGWASVIRANIDWMRDPATQLWRKHMLMFGPSCSPWVVIALLLFGTLGAVALLNFMGFNPALCNSFIAMAAPLLGMRRVLAPSTYSAAPAMPTPQAPVQRQAPPPAAAATAQGSRRTMQPPSIM